MVDLRTTQTDTPTGLEEGLTWRTTVFCSPGTPRTARMLLGFEEARPDKDTLTWNRMICLSGLDCSVSGRFVLDEAHDVAKPHLRLIEFRVKAHVGEQLGVPTLEYDGNEGHLRAFAEWDREEVMVMWKVLAGASQGGCVGEIWRKLFPKEYLKLTLTSF